MEQREMITLGEAARRLKISRHTLRRRIADLRLTVYDDPMRHTTKLLDWVQVEAARQHTISAGVDGPNG